ncbi:Protein of unknown function [Formosa sp. Hel1_31_208]|uniref:DUF2480 family protein n=1 Tax=Formosa sp. Hel1_31_208 TaxID=1798225 RepID=UPI00087ADCFF|nr:DUF2480 family protein [Formosa sp. Hel1_31_208]SDR70596.1 Protein of unknown function [Formosa sp. Hel1_31_208]
MAEDIINRVALSKLMVVDLEDYYPAGLRFVFDIKDWLYEGFVLKEKEFRQQVKDYDWKQHQDQFVVLTCSTDAIIPAWAFMLMTLELQPYARKVCIGDLEALESSIYQDIITNLDVSPYQDKPLIIKGCANKPVPTNAYLMLSAKLKSVAKSIMYGEACSAVPLFKRK